MRWVLWSAVLAVTVGSPCGRGMALAPAPTKAAGFPVKQLLALLGKDLLSDEMQQFREALKEKPIASYGTDLGSKVFFHSWREQGVELRFNEENKLECIFLYADGVGDFKQYKTKGSYLRNLSSRTLRPW